MKKNATKTELGRKQNAQKKMNLTGIQRKFHFGTVNSRSSRGVVVVGGVLVCVCVGGSGVGVGKGGRWVINLVLGTSKHHL